mmetsp:Transcript_8312/g.17737  ORF Transcript_8312/g.17737 Transcript_8312/m.17737 type:complete len:211 (-) Transcript_8312:3085-3717(-)
MADSPTGTKGNPSHRRRGIRRRPLAHARRGGGPSPRGPSSKGTTTAAAAAARPRRDRVFPREGATAASVPKPTRRRRLDDDPAGGHGGVSRVGHELRRLLRKRREIVLANRGGGPRGGQFAHSYGARRLCRRCEERWSCGGRGQLLRGIGRRVCREGDPGGLSVRTFECAVPQQSRRRDKQKRKQKQKKKKKRRSHAWERKRWEGKLRQQ